MLKKDNLISMAEVRGEWCVSVYLPINRSNVKKDRICLKNLMFEAEKKLLCLEMTPQKVARMLGPIEMILDNPGFWNDRTEGIAAFFTPDSFVWYSMQYQFEEMVVVTDRFHLKPLLRNAAKIGRFHLLALGEKQLSFYEASNLGIREVYLKGTPQNLDLFLNSFFPGQSEIEEEKMFKLSEFFRRVDTAVTDYLKDDETPLIVAGADYMHSIYQEANTYPHMLKTGITVDVDNVTPKQLLKQSLPVIKPVFRQKRENALEIYQEKLGKGLATNNFPEIFKAAGEGRIEKLFVPVGKQKWGNFDNNTDELRVHGQAKPGDKDLLCVASSRTLRRGGEVFVVLPEQMPDESSIAAVLRY